MCFERFVERGLYHVNFFVTFTNSFTLRCSPLKRPEDSEHEQLVSIKLKEFVLFVWCSSVFNFSLLHLIIWLWVLPKLLYPIVGSLSFEKFVLQSINTFSNSRTNLHTRIFCAFRRVGTDRSSRIVKEHAFQFNRFTNYLLGERRTR